MLYIDDLVLCWLLLLRFPTDLRALEIDEQFMWGSYLLISPCLEKNARQVTAYFPKVRWYDYYTGKQVSQTGRAHVLDAPLDYIPLHVRGGAIIMTQEPGINTDQR